MSRLITRVDKAHSDAIYGLAWSRAGLLSASLDQTVRAHTPPSSEDSKDVPAPRTLAAHQLAVVSVSASDRDRACSASMDGTVKVFDMSSLSEVRAVDLGCLETWAVSCHSTLPVFATGSHDGNVTAVNYDSEAVVKKSVKPFEKLAMALQFAPEAGSSLCAAGSHSGQVAVVDLEAESLVVKLSEHLKAVRTVSWAAARGQLLSGSEDRHINLYDVRASSQIASLSGHTSWVTSIASSPKRDDVFVSVSADGNLKVWDARKRQIVHALDRDRQVFGGQLWSVVFSPDGSTIAVGADDGSISYYALTAL